MGRKLPLLTESLAIGRIGYYEAAARRRERDVARIRKVAAHQGDTSGKTRRPGVLSRDIDRSRALVRTEYLRHRAPAAPPRARPEPGRGLLARIARRARANVGSPSVAGRCRPQGQSAIRAPSISRVPEPHIGSARGPPRAATSGHPALSNTAHARFSLSGASPPSMR